ncbi:hypothetical protein DID77_04500 [Candidatus Marinamargulisbacteria bacterium SCGC AG-439-L15]|nr:hypothetical protein DID77_04500 [Candidatus Marinamargulisbacteria bacterium SCGC AG-439-L15]
MKNKGSNHEEAPALISKEDLEEVQRLLPDEQFRQFKYLIYELAGYIKRGETEKIQKLQTRIQEKYQKIESLNDLVGRLAKQLKRDSDHQYAKVRMQQRYLDRLKEKKDPEEVIDLFPIGTVEKENIQDPLSPESTPPPTKTTPPVGQKKVKRTAKESLKEPEVSTSGSSQIDLPKDKGAFIDDRPPVTEVQMGDQAIPDEDIVYDKGLSQQEEDIEKAPAKKKKEAPKPTQKKKKPRVKKETDQEGYYKDRKDRIQAYIQEDQMKGHTISIKDMNDETFPED